jgi:hypothetical protein
VEADVRAFPVVEIDPGAGEPGLVPAEALSYAVAGSAATVKALVLSGFGVGDLPSFVLDAEERRALVSATIPHDPDCGLFLVAAPQWTGAAEARLEEAIAGGLAALVGGRRR